eukprot:SM000006S19512  [mRNA]  locus=s6:1275063:1278577:+ [translate_table: standard]
MHCPPQLGSRRRLSATTMSSPSAAALPGLADTVWGQKDLRPKYPKLEKNEVADVVVVGAGIAGLSIAYNLVRSGKSVVVLEYRVRGAGQTGRTTAHLMPWNDDYYYMLEKEFGPSKTWLVGDSHRQAIDWIERVCKEEGIDCKFKRLDGYLFANDDSSDTLQKLQQEFEASKRAGHEDITMEVFDGKDPSLGKMTHAIRFPRAADFHPLMYGDSEVLILNGSCLKDLGNAQAHEQQASCPSYALQSGLRYIDGLADAFVKHGGKLFEQSRVKGQENSSVTTEDGFRVDAKAVVLATNSPINHNLAIHARQAAYRSYVVGLRVAKGSTKSADWWSTASPYHYVRIEEKADHDVLVVGGGDHPVGARQGSYLNVWNNLEEWARSRWSHAGERLYQWSGEVYEPIDKLHLHGRDPLHPPGNTYIATGDSGEGMTGGTIAGMVISDLICGRNNQWAELYDPTRLPPLSMETVQSEGEVAMHTMQGYSDVLPLKGTDIAAIEDLVPDSGGIMQQGLKKVAVYRDESGTVHRRSAVCPHMKCIVQWNPLEKTFDCPCHGSAFDPYGRMINGPAKADLAPI